MGCSLSAFGLMVCEIVNSSSLDYVVHLLGCVVGSDRSVKLAVHDLYFGHSLVAFPFDLKQVVDLTLQLLLAEQMNSF